MFREEIKKHAGKVDSLVEAYPDIATSEAQTKNSLIEPFLRCLGYDPSHPQHVKLEVPTELGGKIDYLLTGRAGVKIAVEAKKASVKLSTRDTNQLRSYFTFSEAVAGVLTNGIDYWLFTDLNKTNVMDSEPYRRVHFGNLTTNDIPHLEALSRRSITPKTPSEMARQEHYRKQVDKIVEQELVSPSEEFLKMIGRRAGVKPLTKSNLRLLRTLVAEAITKAVPRQAPCETESTLQPSETDPDPSPPEKPDADPDPALGAGKKAALTRRNLESATLFGVAIPAGSYKEILLAVVKDLQARHPGTFDDLVSKPPFMKPSRKWQYISPDEGHFHPSYARQKVGDHWVNTQLSAKETVDRSRLFLWEFGHDPDELVIRTSGQ